MQKQHSKLKKNRTAFWLITVSLAFSCPVFAQYSEAEVKAAYLERFTRFIEWPIDTNSIDTSHTFILGIVGENPFGATLDKLYSTQTIKHKSVKIMYISDLEGIDDCDMLYVSRSVGKELPALFARIKGLAILTVGDTEGYAARGIAINLYTDGKRIRYEINEEALRSAHLTVSYLLLKEARLINQKGG